MKPKRPRCFGGAISPMYRGTTTVDAPAPMPDTRRPNAMANTLPAIDSIVAPTRYRTAVARMAGRRPRRDENGPAAKAPSKPPRLKMDDTVAKAASFIGMQSERKPVWSSLGFEEVTMSRRRRTEVEMDFLRHVITS